MAARNEPRPLVDSIGNLAKVSGDFIFVTYLENDSKSHRYTCNSKYMYIYIYNLFDRRSNIIRYYIR